MSQSLKQLCPGHGWCNYQAVDPISIFIQIFILSILVFSGIIIIRNIIKLIQYRNQSKQNRQNFGKIYLHIYVIVSAWLICSLIKVIINICAFYAYINEDLDEFPQPEKHSPIVPLSLIFNSFDSCSTFFVVYLIIYIPCQWLQLTLQFITDVQPNLALKSRKLLSRSYTLVKGIKIYLKLRYILLVIYFIEPILAITTSFGCKIQSYIIQFIIGQSCVIFIFYIFAYFVADTMKNNKIVRMDLKDYRKLKFQYGLLAFTLLGRILLNSFFKGFAQIIFSYQPEKNCSDLNRANDLKRAMFLFFGQIIMHFMPIMVVMFIYRPSIQLKKSQQDLQKNQHSTLTWDETKLQNGLNINKSSQKPLIYDK